MGLKPRIFTKPNVFLNWHYILSVYITTGLLVKYVMKNGKLQVTRTAREVEGHDKGSNLHQSVDGTQSQ